MTPGQRKWLERLRCGPQSRPRFGAYPMAQCVRNGWSRMQWVDKTSKAELGTDEVVERKFQNVEVIEYITEAGLSALAS